MFLVCSTTQIRSTQRTAWAGPRHAGHLLHAAVWRVLPKKVSSAESQLSGHVSAERDVLLDHPPEVGANVQARHDLGQPGELAQGVGQTVSNIFVFLFVLNLSQWKQNTKWIGYENISRQTNCHRSAIHIIDETEFPMALQFAADLHRLEIQYRKGVSLKRDFASARKGKTKQKINRHRRRHW